MGYPTAGPVWAFCGQAHNGFPTENHDGGPKGQDCCRPCMDYPTGGPYGFPVGKSNCGLAHRKPTEGPQRAKLLWAPHRLTHMGSTWDWCGFALPTLPHSKPTHTHSGPAWACLLGRRTADTLFHFDERSVHFDKYSMCLRHNASHLRQENSGKASFNLALSVFCLYD